jgi:hypothetical protein
MDTNFEKEVERVSGELSNAPAMEQLEPEMQEQLRQVEALAAMDPSFANSTEYKDLMASMQQASVQARDEEEEEEEEEDEDDDSEEDSNIDDIFGIMATPKKGKEIKLNFEPPKEMIDFISSKFGVNDASKFFSSVDTWRNQAQEGSEVKKEYEALTADLQAMPGDIRMAVQLWANGEDHTRAFDSSQRLDFSGDFKSQDSESLVQHYFGEQYDELFSSFEDGDISESEFDNSVRLLANSTKRLFAEDKQALEKEREEFTQRQKNEFQNLKKTALLSVENLSKAYPSFSKSEVAKIRTILVEGKAENLFMNADGTYKDDAAELVAYAMYGRKMLESVKKIAERQGESKANQKIVDSSPTALRKNKAAAPQQGAFAKEAGHLSGLFKGDPYA